MRQQCGLTGKAPVGPDLSTLKRNREEEQTWRKVHDDLRVVATTLHADDVEQASKAARD